MFGSRGMNVEVHGGGVGNLHVLGAMDRPGLYYERGLLHPFIDYDVPPPWLNTLVDPMDDEGLRPHLAGARPRLRHQLGLHQQPQGGLTWQPGHHGADLTPAPQRSLRVLSLPHLGRGGGSFVPVDSPACLLQMPPVRDTWVCP